MLWRYHLGVHKTATTHVQKVLESQREKLLAQGFDYVPLAQLRPRTAEIFWKRAFRKLRFRRAVGSSASVMILSEENWLGSIEDACTYPIYPNLEDRLSIMPRKNAVAFLAVRNPADFAASAYSEAMRHVPNLVSLSRTRDAFLSEPSPWFDLVERVRQFFPRLHVWRYEDYRGNEQAFISLIAGIPVDASEIPDPLETRRLPAEVIEELERLRASGGPVPTAATPESSDGLTRFEMFDDHQKLELTRGYERDVDRLRSAGILVDYPR